MQESPRNDADPASHPAERLLATGTHALLTSLGVIRVAGADAVSFLQSQLTQNIAGQAVDRMALAGYCNPKGRLLALMQCIRREDHCLLVTDRSLVAGLVKRLRMYVLRSRVQLEDISERMPVIGVTGAALAAGPEPALSPGSVAERTEGLALARAHGTGQWWLYTDPEAATRAGERLLARAPAVDEAVWRLLDIRDGLPWVCSATSEAFVPQQVNLDLVEGVSFRKGCYPGQEVVARMHYLGKPSRRMIRLRANGPVAGLPDPGTELQTADGDVAGRVVSAARGAAVELLAVVPVKTITSGTALFLASVPLQSAPLPYPLD